MEDPILRPRQAGEYLGGVSTSTLAKWRMSAKGPEFIRLGPALVAYRRSALDRFAASTASRGSRSTHKRDGAVIAAEAAR